MNIIYEDYPLASEEDANKVLKELKRISSTKIRVYLSDLKSLINYKDVHYTDSLQYWDDISDGISVNIGDLWYLALPKLTTIVTD